MERWNPNLYYKNGQEQGFDEGYLKKLIDSGRKLDAQQVPVIFSLAHLARLSGTLYSDLHGFVARASSTKPNFPYRNFTIKKRSGGRRWISVPVPPLMAVQGWIAKNILNGIRVHPAAHAYVSGLRNPLFKHAERHLHADWILHVDVKDFFGNISERQIYRLFRSLNYSDLLAFEMARLCTRVTPRRPGKRWNVTGDDRGVDGYSFDLIGSLPQGAPTSPALSNLIFSTVDDQLENLANENNCTYSRYADDLCFSFQSTCRESIAKFKRMVSCILWDNAFSENRKKTRIISPGSRKLVTGLVVNHNRPTIPKELRDRIRMHLFFCEKYGIPDHCRRKGFYSVLGFRNHLRGLIHYVATIDADLATKFKDSYQRLPWADFEL